MVVGVREFERRTGELLTFKKTNIAEIVFTLPLDGLTMKIDYILKLFAEVM